jgi:tetratricopeptide (TPR) repeat protein
MATLTERIMDASYEVEKAIGRRELRPKLFYEEKLFEIGNMLKNEINISNSADDAIRSYVKYSYLGGRRYDRYSFPTYFLEHGKLNCYTSAAITLSLAEMLDPILFENYQAGYIKSRNFKEYARHVIVRKNTKEGCENIDYGDVETDEYFKEWLGELPITRPKESIVAAIFFNGGNYFYGTEEKRIAAIKFYNKSLSIDPSNEFAWKNKGDALRRQGNLKGAVLCYDKALKIAPDYTSAKKYRGIAIGKIQKQSI